MALANGNVKIAIFLDQNGTIIDDSDGVLLPVTPASFLPGVIYALRKLQTIGMLFIVTNQSSVGLGTLSKDVADQFNNEVKLTLKNLGINITEVFACRHARRDCCECIKPKPFFLLQAQQTFGIDLTRSFVIGDHPHDMELAANAGCTGIYVLTGHGRKHLAELKNNVKICEDLHDAADYIFSQKAVIN